jgi:Fe-Mn family superoxide dismutase
MTFELPTLPYEYEAMEPYIDARTMEIHHTKHHAGYIARLNKALEGRENLRKMSLEEILADIRQVPEEIRQEVRNQGGGHLNHSLLWHTMGPPQGAGPTGAMKEAIDTAFGDFLKFQEQIASAAAARFGSGWVWLCMDTGRKLEVLSTPNQDSPIMLGYHPVLGIDLWEHAYYLKYQNRRMDYISAWWNVVNWRNVSELYHHCLQIAGRAG